MQAAMDASPSPGLELLSSDVCCHRIDFHLSNLMAKNYFPLRDRSRPSKPALSRRIRGAVNRYSSALLHCANRTRQHRPFLNQFSLFCKTFVEF